jgi:alpha-beta hydrolase superfamily lysophospholipase
MFVDLMSATTSDGIVLDGAFFEPAQALSRQGPVDALLLIHGSGGRFYAPATRNMAQDLREQGYACLALNTRGHDTVWVNRQDGTPYGNAYEILDTSRLDLRAGIDYLWELGYRRIGILGHSMGAVKVTYYAATEDQMEAEGKALELMKVNFPIKEIFSAASYLDKHGPTERYNLITLAPQIKIPIFVLAGSLETHTRLRDMARDLAMAAVNSPRAEHVILEGGNHSLNNRRKEASAAVLDWLGSLSPQRVGV